MPTKEPETEVVLTLQEAADFLRVHRSSIYRLLRRDPKAIPGVFKMGSDFRFTLAGLKAFMAAGGTAQ